MQSESFMISFKNYKEAFVNFLLSINQIEVLSLAANEVLSDFPDSLPENIGKPLTSAMEVLTQQINEKLQKKGEISFSITTKGIEQNLRNETSFQEQKKEIIQSTLFSSTLLMGIAQTRLNDSLLQGTWETPKIDFTRIIHFQELVMYFAYLDAFMDDSLRAICHAHPTILKRRKKEINWETLILLGNWSDIFNHIVERFVSEEFSYDSLVERVNYLKELGLDLNCSDNALEFLEETHLFRNLVVHNSGKISEVFIKKSGRNDLQIGSFAPITFFVCDRLSIESQVLASEIFKNVAVRFFRISASSPSLDLIWKPKKKEKS